MRRGQLPAEPVGDWLSRIITETGEILAVAQRLGIDEAQLRRMVAPKPGTRISIAMADRLFVAEEQPHLLATLYPVDVVIVDAWCPRCDEVVTTGDDVVCPWCETPAVVQEVAV